MPNILIFFVSVYAASLSNATINRPIIIMKNFEDMKIRGTWNIFQYTCLINPSSKIWFLTDWNKHKYENTHQTHT